VPVVPSEGGTRPSLAEWREAGHHSPYKPYDGKEIRDSYVGGTFTGQWNTNAPVGVNGEPIAAQMIFASPIFDFRPELGAPEGIDPGAVVPIWRANAFGAGGRFFWQLYGVDAIPADIYLAVYCRDNVHLYNPQLMRSISQWEDITADFFATDGFSVLLELQPAGNPVRFWQTELRFDQREAGANPSLFWDLAYY